MARTQASGRIRAGVGGWLYAPWRGVFYPKGLPHARELQYAAQHLTSIEAVDGCHILFLARSEAAQLAKDLNAVRAKPILTVSDVSAFLDHGGMVQFVVQDKRVRFAVNLQPALQAHLAVSSELLKVAIAVESKPAEEGK